MGPFPSPLPGGLSWGVVFQLASSGHIPHGQARTLVKWPAVSLVTCQKAVASMVTCHLAFVSRLSHPIFLFPPSHLWSSPLLQPLFTRASLNMRQLYNTSEELGLWLYKMSDNRKGYLTNPEWVGCSRAQLWVPAWVLLTTWSRIFHASASSHIKQRQGYRHRTAIHRWSGWKMVQPPGRKIWR